MPRLRLLHCGLLLVGCSSALLCAGTSPGLSDTIEESFIRAAETWDLNHDGKVTCEEWRSYAASLFKKADNDHDGKLTREQFAIVFKSLSRMVPAVACASSVPCNAMRRKAVTST
jgi:hypothetical protein